jgi:hypothetical protein
MAVQKDFITEYGILIQGSNAVNSSTGQTKALQVDGGAAVAKNLIVGSTATIYGLTELQNNLTVNGNSTINDLIVNNTSTSLLTSSSNAVHIFGGTWIDKNLTVEDTANLNKVVVKNLESNTSSISNNALQVLGGAWIDNNLFVKGDAVFDGNVIFLGSATYVYSENSYLTDNILNFHVPNQDINQLWTLDDGKDIGIRFQYYTNTNTNAALVLANDTKWLEWYESGADGLNVISNGVYGTFKTARIRLVGTDSAFSTTTGALTVVGGVGIGGDLWVGGTIYGNINGTISTATNVENGLPGSLVYQRSTSTTDFITIGSTGTILQSNGYTATFVSTSTLFVQTSVYSSYASNILNGTAGQLVYQQATSSTSFIGPGIPGQILVSDGTNGPIYVNTGNIYVGTALKTNSLIGGNTGDIPLQISTGTTSFIKAGNAGDLLQSQGSTATFVSTSTIIVGAAEKWATPRTLTLAGDLSGNVTFDGSTNFTLTATVSAAIIATTATSIITVTTSNNQSYYLTFVDSDNTTPAAESLYTTSSFYIDPSTGDLYLTGTFYGNSIFAEVSTASNVKVVEQTNTSTHYITFVDSNNTTSTAESLYTTSSFTISPGTGNVGINGKLGVNTSTVNDRYTVQIVPTENNSNKVGFAVMGATTDYTNGIEFGESSTQSGGIYWVTSSKQVRITSYNHAYPISFGNNWLYASTSSNIGIGTTVTNSKLTVAGSVSISGITTVTNTTTAISTQTGALQVAGGVGISDTLHVYKTINLGLGVPPTTTGLYLNNTNIEGVNALYFNDSGPDGSIEWNGGSGWRIFESPDDLVTNTGGNLQFVTSSTRRVTFNANGQVEITTSTNATSTNTGALQVVGGTGIGGALYVGGLANISGATSITNTTSAFSTTTGALTVAGGVGIQGSLYVGDTIIGNLTGNVNGNATTVGTKNVAILSSPHYLTFVNSNNSSTTAELFYTTSSLRFIPSTGIVEIDRTTTSTGTTTGALVVTGGVGIGRDLYVGGIIYGTATTATSVNAVQQTANQSYYLTFVDSNNATSTAELLYTTSSITINPSTGEVDILSSLNSTSTTTGALVVSGGAGISGNLYVGGDIVAQRLIIEYTTVTTTLVVTDDIIKTTNNTQSINTTTGALQVTGGAGIGGNLYVGNRVGFVNTSNVSAVYQIYNPITNSLDTVFG